MLQFCFCCDSLCIDHHAILHIRMEFAQACHNQYYSDHFLPNTDCISDHYHECVCACVYV